jgi:hypothetical protein
MRSCMITILSKGKIAMKKYSLFFASFAVALVGCGGGDSLTGDVTLNNEVQTISEGSYVTYALPKGQYNSQISSSNNGIIVEWIGGSNCATSIEVKSYNFTCTLNQQGQLKISNPTLLYLGGSEVVTIKIVQK